MVYTGTKVNILNTIKQFQIPFKMVNKKSRLPEVTGI